MVGIITMIIKPPEGTLLNPLGRRTSKNAVKYCTTSITTTVNKPLNSVIAGTRIIEIKLSVVDLTAVLTIGVTTGGTPAAEGGPGPAQVEATVDVSRGITIKIGITAVERIEI